jgi:hypothetical protein
MHKAVVAEGKRSEGPTEYNAKCLRASDSEYLVELFSDPPRELTVPHSTLWQCAAAHSPQASAYRCSVVGVPAHLGPPDRPLAHAPQVGGRSIPASQTASGRGGPHAGGGSVRGFHLGLAGRRARGGAGPAPHDGQDRVSAVARGRSGATRLPWDRRGKSRLCILVATSTSTSFFLRGQYEPSPRAHPARPPIRRQGGSRSHPDGVAAFAARLRSADHTGRLRWVRPLAPQKRARALCAQGAAWTSLDF